MGKHEFRYLSQEDILSLNIPYMDVIDAVEQVMSEFGKGSCQPLMIRPEGAVVMPMNA